jgi:serine/threonine protein kinase
MTISQRSLGILTSWVQEVNVEFVGVHQQPTFRKLVNEFLEPYINDQEGADRSTFQLLALGCMQAVSCYTTYYPFGTHLQSELCDSTYTLDELNKSNHQFLAWLIATLSSTTPPGPKKRILDKTEKSIVFLTDDKVVVKCTSHIYATIEVLSQSLLPRGPIDGIVTLLGGEVIDDDTVELFYTYLPLALRPSTFTHGSVVKAAVRDIVQGVHVLHTRDMAHRDLKFPNIRLTKEGRATLIDLDSTGYGPRSTNIVSTITTRAPEGLQREVNGVGGEEDHVYDPKPLDMWSLGIMTLELAHGYCLPVPDDNSASNMLQILDHYLPKVLSSHGVQEGLGPKLFEAVRRCTLYDPDLRPTIEQLRVAADNNA